MCTYICIYLYVYNAPNDIVYQHKVLLLGIGCILCLDSYAYIRICIYCLVTQNLELIADKRGLSQESTAIDDSSNYSAILQNQPNVKHNNNVGYKVSKHHICIINNYFTGFCFTECCF